MLGMSSTNCGFAFVVAEGPDRLVDWGCRRTKPSRPLFLKAISKVLESARPLFVVVRREAYSTKRLRGHLFRSALLAACRVQGIMILHIQRRTLEILTGRPRPSKWDIAACAARCYPGMAHKLPGKRKAWESEDERVHVFVALAVALAAWHSLAN
jgi:hypothetical protein